MKKTRTIVFMGLLIALDVIAASYLTIKLPQLKIGVSFLPVAFTGMLFGPLLGGVGAGMADIIQYFLSSGGGYIPGITLDAFLSGAVYGLLLYKKNPSLPRVFLASVINRLVISAGLTTLWLSFVTSGKTYWALFVPRLTVSLIMIPIETVVIFAVWQASKRIRAFGF